LPAGATKCHTIRGIEHIGTTCPRGRNVTFEESGHWLYWEEARRFDAEILEFVKMCSAEGPVGGNGQE
jgi:pimeloyl-ACP methyl ester carboxylesterase